MPNTLKPANLGSIARGALLELFERCAQDVARNIADTSTDATATRGVTLKLEFKPDADRVGVEVITTASCKLASVARHKSRAYVNKDTKGGAYLFDEDPRQAFLFEPPAEADNMLAFRDRSAGV